MKPLVLLLLLGPALLLLLRRRTDPPPRRTSSRWWGGALLALGGPALLLVALAPGHEERRRRGMSLPRAEAVARRPPDAGSPDAQPPAAPAHGAMMADDAPVYAAERTAAADCIVIDEWTGSPRCSSSEP